MNEPCAIASCPAANERRPHWHTLPADSNDDGPCQECGIAYPPWWVDHEIWNRTIGGPDAVGDQRGMLCPTCFLRRADPVRGAWHITPPKPQRPRLRGVEAVRIPCWLAGHRREREPRFVRRLDGYPVAIYRLCERCGKRLDMNYGRLTTPEPPSDPELAAKWAEEFERP